MSLPCAQIIAFLTHYKENPFKPSLCSQHWLRERAQFMSEFAYSTSKPSKADIVLSEPEKRTRDMTANEKFNTVSVETKKICEILAKKPQNEYNEWLKTLKDFRSCVENNQRPNILHETESVLSQGLNKFFLSFFLFFLKKWFSFM